MLRNNIEIILAIELYHQITYNIFIK